MARSLRPQAREALAEGGVFVAHPLALTQDRTMDVQHQRALTRYYTEAGARGIAVGVHTTQFRIRDPEVNLLEPVLRLVAQTLVSRDGGSGLLRIAGVCGERRQALAEAALAADLGYDVALVSLAGVDGDEHKLVDHIREVGRILPVCAFYLQPAVGGRPLSWAFWRDVADLECVVAAKLAPFDRYATTEAIRGVLASERWDEVTLLTGNDDHIVADLLTTFRLGPGDGQRTTSFAGGLLGQWAVGTKAAVDLCARARRCRDLGSGSAVELLEEGARLTDLNGAVFDARHGFRGCIPGIHEVLRRQGLMVGARCVDDDEVMSPGQAQAIDRVIRAYPEFLDTEFIEERLAGWLAG